MVFKSPKGRGEDNVLRIIRGGAYGKGKGATHFQIGSGKGKTPRSTIGGRKGRMEYR